MSTNAKVIRDMSTKIRPDIRLITRLVPPSGNLVQGQSELAINPTSGERGEQGNQRQSKSLQPRRRCQRSA